MIETKIQHERTIEMKVNEENIPFWILKIISSDEIYRKLNNSIYKNKEIEIEDYLDKYRLMFEISEENSTWSLKEIYKRNPQGLWYKI